MRLRCGVFWGVLGGLRERGIEIVEMMNVEGNGKPWRYLINAEDRSLERTFLEMEGNNKKANTSSIDVISTLPDNVRSRILAFLTTKAAALALFLSKK
ncbi:hypothetical protein F2Q68_00017593 [Brassica cretica]|uniref:Uncharacterized protein n=1 Tax=Brassica cretica TaxID=69181 RepID=A0A8S9HSC4_BRACR|nr:hypothetical protein F2Q68_00017593 [Brassica cretica]